MCGRFTLTNKDKVKKRFNIDLSRRIKHNALLDCELLREVYIHLLDAKEPKFNLSSGGIEEKKEMNSKRIYNKRKIQISDQELKKHKEFLKNQLKRNFY